MFKEPALKVIEKKKMMNEYKEWIESLPDLDHTDCKEDLIYGGDGQPRVGQYLFECVKPKTSIQIDDNDLYSLLLYARIGGWETNDNRAKDIIQRIRENNPHRSSVFKRL
jgi:hypothetical protein